MIFVTVGTHEQPFNRLIKYMDNLKSSGIITEDVVIQTGYSTFEPQFCKWHKLFSYQEMLKNMEDARIVITHGGPSSFIMPLQMGKIPVVIPRRKEFNEHINNHQVDFGRKVSSERGNIIFVEEIEKLKEAILNYDKLITGIQFTKQSNNKLFCEKFNTIVNDLFK